MLTSTSGCYARRLRRSAIRGGSPCRGWWCSRKSMPHKNCLPSSKFRVRSTLSVPGTVSMSGSDTKSVARKPIQLAQILETLAQLGGGEYIALLHRMGALGFRGAEQLDAKIRGIQPIQPASSMVSPMLADCQACWDESTAAKHSAPTSTMSTVCMTRA